MTSRGLDQNFLDLQRLSSIHCIEKSYARIELGDLSRFVERIVDSTVRLVSGVGTSGHLARKLSASLTSIGLRTNFLDPVSALHGELGQVDDAVLIVVSNSGSSEEFERLLQQAQPRLRSLLVITGSSESSLSARADFVLLHADGKETDPIQRVPTNSALALTFAMNVLISACELALADPLQEFTRNHPGGALGLLGKARFRDLIDVPRFPVHLISGDCSISDASDHLNASQCGMVMVALADRTFIFTDGDLRRAISDSVDLSTSISRYLTEEFFFCTDDAVVSATLAQMRAQGRFYSSIPIYSNGAFEHIFLVQDLLKFLIADGGN